MGYQVVHNKDTYPSRHALCVTEMRHLRCDDAKGLDADACRCLKSQKLYRHAQHDQQLLGGRKGSLLLLIIRSTAAPEKAAVAKQSKSFFLSLNREDWKRAVANDNE